MLVFIIDARPHERFRRQLNPHRKDGLPYIGWGGGTNNPSGAIPGAYYGDNRFYQ
jgi:3-mercaptopyruvate sulfurtransferase SseA